jgi:hypothetical protein
MSRGDRDGSLVTAQNDGTVHRPVCICVGSSNDILYEAKID